MTTVLIVDDQPLHRLGLRMLLESIPETQVAGGLGRGQAEAGGGAVAAHVGRVRQFGVS